MNDVAITIVADLTFEVSVAGSTNTGYWDIVTYRLDADKLAGLSMRTTSGVLSCWPSFSSPDVAVTDCVDCYSVHRLTYVGGNEVIAAMTAGAASERRPVLVWFRPLSAIGSETVAVQPLSGTCTMSSGPFDVTRYSHTHAALVATTTEYGFTPTAMAIDSAANVTYVALEYATVTVGNPSILLKFLLDPTAFAMYGRKQLNYVMPRTNEVIPETLSAMSVDLSARLLYALVKSVADVRVVTFLLYEVSSLSPDLADQRGGTVISVRGRGFQNISTTMCSIGGILTVARSITADAITCATTESTNESSTLSACEGEAVEVSLHSFRWFTENSVTLRRAQTARITSISPDRGQINRNTSITLHGQGFVDSTFSLCKFSLDAADNTTIVFNQPVRYLSSTAVVCSQPTWEAHEASYELDLAVDGQLTTGFPLIYQIVGGAANISTTMSTLTLSAANRTTFSVTVVVVDSQKHKLGALDNKTHIVELQTRYDQSGCVEAEHLWLLNNSTFPFPACRNVTLQYPNGRSLCTGTSCTGDPSTDVITGEVMFKDLAFVQPTSGTFYLYFVVRDIPSWRTQISIVVTEGDPYALALFNWHSFSDNFPGFANGEKLSPPPKLIVVDRLGNTVNLVNLGQKITMVCETYFKNISADDEISNVIEGRRIASSFDRPPEPGTIDFTEIYLRFIHGAVHFLNFSSTSHVLRPVESPPLMTKLCDTTTYKVRSSTEGGEWTGRCQPCPPVGAKCDGSDIVEVLPGYWRLATVSYIYECPGGSDVCLGNRSYQSSRCQKGHQGPLCSVCAPGYGKSGSTGCTECSSVMTNVIIVSLFAVAVLCLLTAWTVVTLRKSEITDFSVILRTVTNHLQATGKLGEFSTQWDPFLKSVFQVESTGSDLSVTGFSAVECLLQAAHGNYQTIFWAYIMLPVVPLVMAFVVFVIVRLLKLRPVITTELRREVEEELRHFPSSRAGLILKQYPYFMVLITTLCVHLFTMYQTLISQSTSVLTCKDFVTEEHLDSATGKLILTSQYYLAVDMRIQCESDGSHDFRNLALFTAIGYGFGVPLAFIFGYKFVTGRIGKPELTKLMFMFLTGGYKEEYWFWQALIMMRKMILVLSIVFISDNRLLQSYCGMWVMSVALVLQIWYSPNIKPEHNLVEALSLAIITITLNLGLLYFWPDMPSTGKDVLTAVLIAITIGAMCMFVYYLYEPAKETILQFFQSILLQLKSFGRPKPAEPKKLLRISEMHMQESGPVGANVARIAAQRHRGAALAIRSVRSIKNDETGVFEEVELGSVVPMRSRQSVLPEDSSSYYSPPPPVPLKEDAHSDVSDVDDI